MRPGVGPGCPGAGWAFLGFGLWTPLSACSFTWSTAQPTVQPARYAMDISLLDSEIPTFQLHLPPL